MSKKNPVTHNNYCQPICPREKIIILFSADVNILLCVIFVKALFSSMACAGKQMAVEEKNAILSMTDKITTRCNPTILRLVKRCDETTSKENRSRRAHRLGGKKPR